MKKVAEISTQAAGNDINVADAPVYGTESFDYGDWLKRKRKKNSLHKKASYSEPSSTGGVELPFEPEHSYGGDVEFKYTVPKKKKMMKKTAALETAEGKGPGNKLIADRQPNVYEREPEQILGFTDNFMAMAQGRNNKKSLKKTAGWRDRRDMLLENADAMVTIFGYAGSKLKRKKRLQDQQLEGQQNELLQTV